MILPENTKMPMGVNRHIFNKEIKNVFLAPGDTVTLDIQNRTFEIKCRGVWKSCLCFKIAGYRVKEIK